jgi:hypothetical protein
MLPIAKYFSSTVPPVVPLAQLIQAPPFGFRQIGFFPLHDIQGAESAYIANCNPFGFGNHDITRFTRQVSDEQISQVFCLQSMCS